jgi:cytochrome c peroxidase
VILHLRCVPICFEIFKIGYDLIMNRYITISLLLIGLISVFSSFSIDEPEDIAALGKLLFFDPILSKDNTVSCATCHRPQYAFADTSAISTGVGGKKGKRNTPSAMNLLLDTTFFWDGRARTLEEQALAPIANPDEMNLPVAEAIKRLKRNKKYDAYFKKIFNSEPTAEYLAKAIATFERTLETSDSPFDNWKFSEDPNAVTDAVKRGFTIFNEKGKCVKCHFGADFTNHEFRNIGLFDGKNWNDSGRFAVTKKSQDIGKFKTPTLRNIAITAPYMHNGKAKTLMDVIDFYDDTEKLVPNPINKDSILAKPLGLTQNEKKDLEAFLISLTDKKFINQ